MDDDESLNGEETQRKRRRDPNFSEEEQNLLAELVKPYLDILENKSCLQSSLDSKERKWVEISEQFNLCQPTCPREWKKLRDLYQRMKFRAKKEAKCVLVRSSIDSSLPTQINNHEEFRTQEIDSVGFQYGRSASTSNEPGKTGGEESAGTSRSASESDSAEVGVQLCYGANSAKVSPADCNRHMNSAFEPVKTNVHWNQQKQRFKMSMLLPRAHVFTSAGSPTKRLLKDLPAASLPVVRKIQLGKRPHEEKDSADVAATPANPDRNTTDDQLRRFEIERHRKAMEVYEEQLLAARAQRLYYDYKLKLLRTNCGS